MNDFQNDQDLDFKVDTNNLYREEALTDLKVASIRRLVPVLADGSDDTSRSIIFIGSTQLMTPDGPLPLQARLEANNLREAYEEFPNTMKKALDEMMHRFKKMQQQQEAKKKEESRIIMPGR